MWWLLAVPASGYTFATDEAGGPLRWASFPVTYTWSPGGDPVPGLDPQPLRATVDAGFDVWSRVDGAEARFAAEAHPGPPRVDPAAPNFVFVPRTWPYDPGLLALTASWADGNGRIVAYDLLINGDQPWAVDGDPDAFDLQAAITHEVGHALGLDHSEHPDAAMYATALPGAVWRRDLHDDDQQAIRALYPHRGGRSGTGGGPSTWHCDARPGEFTPLGLGFALVALTFQLRRHR